MVYEIISKRVIWFVDDFTKPEFKVTPEEHFGGPKESDAPAWRNTPEETIASFVRVFGSIWDACVALAEEEKARKDNYERGEWHYTGCKAEALVKVGDNVPFTIATPGVMGISSMSPESYLDSVEESQYELLDNILGQS